MTPRAHSSGGKQRLGGISKQGDGYIRRLLVIGATAVIPSNRTRRIIIPHDADAYKQRNRIERCFCQLKHFRRLATRYDRRSDNFTGFIHLAAAMIWMQ